MAEDGRPGRGRLTPEGLQRLRDSRVRRRWARASCRLADVEFSRFKRAERIRAEQARANGALPGES